MSEIVSPDVLFLDVFLFIFQRSLLTYFIQVILGSIWEPLVDCFCTLPLRDHTIVKLLSNLKKHALQDDMKVLGVEWIMFNIFCGRKQSKYFGLFLLG